MAEYIDLPPVNLPTIEFDFERDGGERIEEIAEHLREFWNVGFGPVTDLAPLLEYNGIIVVEEPVNCDDMDAVSRWQGGRPYIISYTLPIKRVIRGSSSIWPMSSPTSSCIPRSK
jgi:hypothetical protein